MRGATYSNPMQAPPVTGRAFGRLALAIVAVLLVGIGLVVAAMQFRSQGPPAPTTPVEQPIRPWKAQSVYAQLKEEPVIPALAATPPPPEDTLTPRIATLEKQNKDLRLALEELRQAKAQPPRGPQPPPPPPKPAPKPPGAPLHIVNKLEPMPPVPLVKEYTLAPGGKIPFILETKIVSDVEGYLTGRVSSNVYDTATGRHLLVPQGSTILGNTQSSKLVYGNERLDTVTLKLAFPDGRSVDLERAPITDQEGVAGLTGDVDQHYLRLLAAVLIQGVLRGGATAVSTAAAGAAGGQVITGVTSTGAQTGTTITGPLLSTRPTITVEAGQLANIILLQPLKLPAMWQDGEPREAVQAKKGGLLR